MGPVELLPPVLPRRGRPTGMAAGCRIRTLPARPARRAGPAFGVGPHGKGILTVHDHHLVDLNPADRRRVGSRELGGDPDHDTDQIGRASRPNASPVRRAGHTEIAYPPIARQANKNWSIHQP